MGTGEGGGGMCGELHYIVFIYIRGVCYEWNRVAPPLKVVARYEMMKKSENSE